MIIEIKIPSPGESVSEVEVGRWMVENGALVKKNQEIAEVESDKATLTIIAEAGGKISILAAEGQVVLVGTVVCTIDTSFGTVNEEPALSDGSSSASVIENHTGVSESPGSKVSDPALSAGSSETQIKDKVAESGNIKITSVGREMMKAHQLSVDEILSGLKRIGRKEVEAVVSFNETLAATPAVAPVVASREVKREKMTMLRRKLSERLVSVRNETAMLTTFNEVDMSLVMEIRKQYQQKFSDKHGLKLGFMAFFTKAVALAAQYHPSINSMLDGEDLVFPQFVDVGIAVQTPKGLMVPVVRNAESKSIPQIELEIKELAEKARNKKITVEELSGGTFTITNGGVFGSLLSTPILNPPQSAILGMHNIVDRPVAVNGKVEIRPMMYIALSYDHRVIDGKDSVGFLVRVKEMIENPQKMVTQGRDPIELMLEI
jgi:2-oxoglutarate dehydrogenase E2 component (dihydrolipoamide succinyltransferase)